MAERQAIAQISRQPYEHETKHGTRTKMQKKTRPWKSSQRSQLQGDQ